MPRRRIEIRQVVERKVTLQLNVEDGQERETIQEAMPDDPAKWRYGDVLEQSWRSKGEG